MLVLQYVSISTSFVLFFFTFIILVFVLLKHIQILFDIANHFPKYVQLCCQSRCARYTNNSDKINDAPLKMKLTASAFMPLLVMFTITIARTVHADHATPQAADKLQCHLCNDPTTRCIGDYANHRFVDNCWKCCNQ
jgi:hypothetical protein